MKKTFTAEEVKIILESAIAETIYNYNDYSLSPEKINQLAVKDSEQFISTNKSMFEEA